MQIIIPMTGYGSRFVAAGYKELKPFIPVQGIPIIEWIIKGMYPDEKNIMFICRKEHLINYPTMKKKLLTIAPFARIFAVDNWIKKGPVFDILRASEMISDDDHCIINYCDFYMTWDYKKFVRQVNERDCAGAVPCYSGFHPHLIPTKNFYASCLTDEDDNLIEIREKFSFEKDKTKSKHSPGVYYFRSGAIMKKYCQEIVDAEDMLNGEFYASLPYNYMVRDGLKVWAPVNVDKFCQWGTPEDMKEYLFWINMFIGNYKVNKEDDRTTISNIIIPMAGAGKRFTDAGYKLSKPVIPTFDRRSGEQRPMVVCATMDLPGVKENGSNITYIDRNFHKIDGVEDKIKQYYPDASFITVDKLTEGQACTCMFAKELINNDGDLLIAGCDNGMVIDVEIFNKLRNKCDVLAFTYRHNEAVLNNPNAYGWMIVDETTGKVTNVSIKKAISDNPMDDHAIVATFWFKHGSDFVRATEKMIYENDRVNGEFYVDQVMKHAIELGLDVRVFEIERYIGWGTPKDYEEYQATFTYWKEFTDSEGFLPRRGL